MYTDLLIKIKNAQAVGHKSLESRFSKMDLAVLKVLEKAGFIKSIEIKGRSVKKVIEINFNENNPIRGIKFLSKPSVKQHSGFKDFKPVKGGHGVLVVSTSRGVMSDKDAKKEKVGGQLLFEIW